eukprot:1734049-Prymnesium_polylepis.1
MDAARDDLIRLNNVPGPNHQRMSKVTRITVGLKGTFTSGAKRDRRYHASRYVRHSPTSRLSMVIK